MTDDTFKESALRYHAEPTPGKLAIRPTKPLANGRDLARAYSPGVAFACELIVEDPAEAARMTARGNLVAVITNGTAVLGLGDIGPLAAKPVMEGKAVLFKKFADIDVFDIEIQETRVYDPRELAASSGTQSCCGSDASAPATWDGSAWDQFEQSGGQMISAFVRARKPE